MRAAFAARITRAPRLATDGVRWGPFVFRVSGMKAGSAWTGPVASFQVRSPINAMTVLSDVPRRPKLSPSARKDRKERRKAASRARRKNR